MPAARLNFDRPRHRTGQDTVTFGPTLQRPRLRVNVQIPAQQLPLHGVGLLQMPLVRRVEIDLRLHPSVGVAVYQDLRRAVAPVRSGRVKNTVLEEKRVARVQPEVADLDARRIDLPLRDG